MKKCNLLGCLTWNGLDDNVSKSLSDLFLLALRVYMAWIFLKSGLIKLENWDSTLALFQYEYQVPVLSPILAAYLGTAGELIFPIFIIIGLFTRWAAIGLFVVNVVAVISYPQLSEVAVREHRYWAILIAAIFVFGAGRLSLDYVLRRK